jgi:hypothetical protein
VLDMTEWKKNPVKCLYRLQGEVRCMMELKFKREHLWIVVKDPKLVNLLGALNYEWKVCGMVDEVAKAAELGCALNLNVEHLRQLDKFCDQPHSDKLGDVMGVLIRIEYAMRPKGLLS